MSYQVLARKWRPRVFSEMVGQEHVLRALINALDQRRLHQAYLFTGTRGVGKTTVARILAKCLNCERGVSSTPCGECSACRSIAEGRFVDLIEVDAASRTKVEDTRELLDNVQYAPTMGRYKVYLIDEVHMLSGHSFNALLKTLEEPPPHVVFLLATTDPHKLPITVLSRCLQFNLKNLAPDRIAGHLQHVLTAEQIPYADGALRALARAADGSMRDALSLTDQAIAQGAGEIAEADVNAMLGTIDRSTVLAICRALAARDGLGMLQQVERLAEQAPDYTAALAEALSIWHRVAIAQAVPEALDESLTDHREVLELATQLRGEDVQLLYQICLLGRRDLGLAANARAGFEMTLLRALAFQPATADSRPPPPPPAPPTTPARPPAPPPERAAATPTRTGATVGDPPAAAVAPPRRPDDPVAPPVAKCEIGSEAGTAPAPTATTARIALGDLGPEHWVAICGELAIGGILHNVAANLVLLGHHDGRLAFQLDANCASLYDPTHQRRLAETLSAYFGQPVQVDITIGGVTGETPQAHRLRLTAERQAAAVAALRGDPVVNHMLVRFGGKLLEDTIIPIDPKSAASEAP